MSKTAESSVSANNVCDVGFHCLRDNLEFVACAFIFICLG